MQITSIAVQHFSALIKHYCYAVFWELVVTPAVPRRVFLQQFRSPNPAFIPTPSREHVLCSLLTPALDLCYVLAPAAQAPARALYKEVHPPRFFGTDTHAS